jgi:hypothetical protein
MYPRWAPRFSLGSEQRATESWAATGPGAMPGLDGPPAVFSDRSARTRSANTATSPNPSPPGGSGRPLTRLQTLHGKE